MCFAAEFRGADSLMISEVHCVLLRLVDRQKEADPAYNPSQMLQKTLTYTKRFSNVQSQAAISQIRKCAPPYSLCKVIVSTIKCYLPLSLTPESIRIPSGRPIWKVRLSLCFVWYEVAIL